MSTQILPDRYIKVGNVNTRYWVLGDEGTTVILLHGIGGSVENWMLNINALAQHHRVYAIDMVGFGRSDNSTVLHSFSHGAQFVSDFMRTQHIDRATLIGNSMGGGIALQFTIQFPDMVERLVLASSAGLGKELSFILRLVTLPLIGELLTRPNRKKAARFLRECVYDPALLTDNLVELFYQLASLPNARKSFLSTLRTGANLRGMHTDIINSIVENLTTITAPTMILWGQQDRIIPVAHAHVAHEKIPNTELHILDPCGHLPQLECSEEFNTLVLDFLAI